MTPRFFVVPLLGLCCSHALAAAAIWKPVSPLSWQIQLSGTLNTTVKADVFAIDAFDTTAATISALHAQGKKVMCGFSAGTFENWRSDAAKFPKAVIGNTSGWSGENWLDIRNLTALGPIMKARLDLAKSKGCDSVNPANVDGYTQSTGFPLTAAQQIAFNTFLATEAHARGMAIGLMNDIAQIPSLVGAFDYALSESCYSNQQCDRLSPFTAAGKPVLNIEYTATLAQFCPSASALKINSIRKNAALDAYVGVCPTNTTTSPPPVVTPPPVVSPPPVTGSYWKPKGKMSWQIQFSGTQDTSIQAAVYFIDAVDSPATRISQIHSQGQKAVCYFSAGTFENWRPDAASFPASVKGSAVGGWPGENWLDIRQISILKPIMQKRIAVAKQKGCDGVMIDNDDNYTNSTGFPLSASDQLAYNRMLATEVHAQNMAIGLNNDLNQIPDLVASFDFAINESCMEYNECAMVSPFVAAGKTVFHLEYAADINSICATGNSYGFSSMKKNQGLDAWRDSCN